MIHFNPTLIIMMKITIFRQPTCLSFPFDLMLNLRGFACKLPGAPLHCMVHSAGGTTPSRLFHLICQSQPQVFAIVTTRCDAPMSICKLFVYLRKLSIQAKKDRPTCETVAFEWRARQRRYRSPYAFSVGLNLEEALLHLCTGGNKSCIFQV